MLLLKGMLSANFLKFYKMVNEKNCYYSVFQNLFYYCLWSHHSYKLQFLNSAYPCVDNSVVFIILNTIEYLKEKKK